MGQKILHPLGWCNKIAAAQAVSRRFQPALKGYPRQGIAAVEILRPDAHQKTAVDVFAVAGVFAHAVGHQRAPVPKQAATTVPPGQTQK